MSENNTIAGHGERPQNIQTTDRGIPQVGRKKGATRIWYIITVAVIIVAVAALAATAALNKFKSHGQSAAVPHADVVSTQTELSKDAFEPPLPEDVKPQTSASVQSDASGPAKSADPKLTPDQQRMLDLLERRKRAPVVAVGTSIGTDSGAASRGENEGGSSANDSNSLSQSLRATRTGVVAATMLQDPNLTITQGHLLPCTLETAISSTVAGMTSCVLLRDVYSTNGRVLLMERGSRVIGQYQGGQVQRGQKRIGVLWTRVETPNGVLINLDSLAADPIGRTGIDGKINRHFWERFGAAMLVSVVDDMGQYLANNANDNAGDRITFGNTSGAGKDAAAIIVANSVNIPPTLEKAQGSSVGIFVARDLYFGDVYTLRPKAASL